MGRRSYMAATDTFPGQLSEAEHSRHLRRAVIASTVGTTIEWYDFLIFEAVRAEQLRRDNGRTRRTSRNPGRFGSKSEMAMKDRAQSATAGREPDDGVEHA